MVFDASPLIFFDVLGYAGQLPQLHRIVALPGEPGSGLPAKEWVQRRVPRSETLRGVGGELTRGGGEKEDYLRHLFGQEPRGAVRVRHG